MADKLEKDKERENNKNNVFLNPSKKSKNKPSGRNNDNISKQSDLLQTSSSKYTPNSNYNQNHNNNSNQNSNPFMNKNTVDHYNNNSIRNVKINKNIYIKNANVNANEKINLNNDDLFPELLSSSSQSLLSLSLNGKHGKKNNKKQNKAIDFLSAIQCIEPIKKDVFDDIDPGWVVMYFDENKQIRKEYGPSTGITEQLEKEIIEKHTKEINELFAQREREIQESIELFGDERLYKPELENYKEPEIYYGNESDYDENSLDDNINGDSGYIEYHDEYI